MSAFPTVDQVAAAISAHEPMEVPAFPGRSNPNRAGVLVPLFWDPDPVCVVTIRTSKLREHSGEVVFPGGKPEPDEDLRDTALREAREELGLVPGRLFGRLSSVPVYTSSYRLVPWVGQLDAYPSQPNPDEVARVVPLRISEILHQDFIDGIPFDYQGVRSLSPVFATGAKPMFGATAHCFLELLHILAPLFETEVPPLAIGRWTWDDLKPR